jgi:hypothetical protein
MLNKINIRYLIRQVSDHSSNAAITGYLFIFSFVLMLFVWGLIEGKLIDIGIFKKEPPNVNRLLIEIPAAFIIMVISALNITIWVLKEFKHKK